LKEIGTLGSKPVDTYIDPNIHFDQNLGEPLANPGMYKRLIGKLIYLTVTRSDIRFVVGVLSQYVQSSYWLYWTACRILRYLKGF